MYFVVYCTTICMVNKGLSLLRELSIILCFNYVKSTKNQLTFDCYCRKYCLLLYHGSQPMMQINLILTS